jgi:hypothetical protein
VLGTIRNADPIGEIHGKRYLHQDKEVSIAVQSTISVIRGR